MKNKTNTELIQEAITLNDELQYIYFKAPSIVRELKSRQFSAEEIEQYNIDLLINDLDIL